ncbi:MAG: T9SS type A sorting domain-containing protein [Chlorobi bacterium]|nr:MAG: hypothetical protein UZ07_CHB004002906 [Chlorobi bacterium OLB7]MBK8910255.1 T9SS type A sorting domain-containing protein [Chlorobiota bacterium]
MRTLLVFTALLFLLPPLVEAYHVGEKPRPAPPSDAGKPQILRVSQTELEFGSAVAGPVALRISDVRGNLLSNNGRYVTEAEPINGKGRFVLNLDNLRSGVYFIVLSNSAGVSSRGVLEVK